MNEKHEALRDDFAMCVLHELVAEDRDLSLRGVTSLANRLVHLVVLHGLLPETEPATTENQA